MTSQDYSEYKSDWDTFNKIWIYNYTIETLNTNASAYGPYGSYPILGRYEYHSQDERVSYIRGHYTHVSAYPSSTNLFITIPPINMSTFYGLSTMYGVEYFAKMSTIAGISTATENLFLFNLNLSTLGTLSTIRSISTLSLAEISTISSIITPSQRTTYYSIDGATYLSTVLEEVVVDLFPSTIRPVGVSTVASFVSSYILSLDTPSTFCSYVASTIIPTSYSSLSVLKSLSTLFSLNNTYSYFPPPNISTYSSLSTLLSLNNLYSFFSQAQRSTLASLSNTFLYPESRLSTYVSLSTLASLSTLYPALPSTTLSTLNSLSTIGSLSTLYPALSTSNISTLFFISTRLSLYSYMSTASLQLGSNDVSTFYTVSSYSYFLPPM